MSTRRKWFLALGGFYLVSIVAVILIFGAKRQDNDAFKPQEEFRLTSWIDLPGPMDINRGVFYVLVAAILTLMRDNITHGNMPDKMAARWFPFLGALFLFIWYSNLIGYIPLPTNSHEKVNILGAEIPQFAIYAATANVSVPLVLALVVWVSYNVEGVRAKGLGGYLKSLVPAGVSGAMAPPIFVLEFVSNFMRLVSLSVRLFANILAGHLIILFMSGGLAVLLGLEVLGIFTLPFGVALFLFEVGLVATLQAFIFATLSAIYLGGAVAESH
jgi:F-type H+-transporting ATPase subunit a